MEAGQEPKREAAWLAAAVDANQEAAVGALGGMLSGVYRSLVEGGVPEQYAAALTQAFMLDMLRSARPAGEAK